MRRKQPLILIADDDRDSVDGICIRCRSIGLAVHCAYDGITAMQMVDELRPDMVILDVNMPGKSGLDVVEVMTNNRYLSSIPVIILTGKGNLEVMIRAQDMLAYFIPKCGNNWERIEPLMRELIFESPEYKRCVVAAAIRPRTNRPESEWRSPEPATQPECHIEDLFALLSARPVYDCPPIQTYDCQQKTAPLPWVLCIEDDRELAHGLRMRLKQHGVRSLRAFSGIEGFRQAFRHSPAAVILDFELPSGDGGYILRRLKETPATKAIPVIVVTGHKNTLLEQQMYQLGASKFFNKPIEWNDLWVELQLHLEKRLQTQS